MFPLNSLTLTNHLIVLYGLMAFVGILKIYTVQKKDFFIHDLHFANCDNT